MKTIFFIFLTLFSLESVACKCQDFTVEEKVNSADYIYFGQVVSSKLVAEKDVVNEMSIIEVIKGKPDSTQLYSRVDTHMCAMFAATGLTFVVYGKYHEKPRLSLCSNTQPLIESLDPEFEQKLASIKSAANKPIKQD